MNLAERKYNFIQELNVIDEGLLDRLEIFLKANKNEIDWSLELSSDEKSEIEIGMQQAANNEFISHENVMNKFAKWH